MSRRQQILNFVRRGGSYMKVSGKGLIKGHNGKKLSLRGSSVAQKHNEELGGTIRYNSRPYQLKDTTPKKHTAPKYTPIHFKL